MPDAAGGNLGSACLAKGGAHAWFSPTCWSAAQRMHAPTGDFRGLLGSGGASTWCFIEGHGRGGARETPIGIHSLVQRPAFLRNHAFATPLTRVWRSPPLGTQSATKSPGDGLRKRDRGAPRLLRFATCEMFYYVLQPVNWQVLQNGLPGGATADRIRISPGRKQIIFASKFLTGSKSFTGCKT